MKPGPIGVFDSGYGGLSILKEFIKQLPEYDYLYLGDNARAPYGSRSAETIYNYTFESVNHLFSLGCNLVILACNTASADALRTIQRHDLLSYPGRRVLGIIKPTSEVISRYTKTGKIGILGTIGVIKSQKYNQEIKNLFPDIEIFGQACPLWVTLVENNEHNSPGADYFVKKYLNLLMDQSKDIDVILLACTHYPLLINKIKQFISPNIKILTQGDIVAKSLKDYLKRHTAIDAICSKGGEHHYLTSEDPDFFNDLATIFFDKAIKANKLNL